MKVITWIKHINIKTITSLGILLASSQSLSYDIKQELTHGHPSLQLGGFWSIQGKPQQININGLIGDYFNVRNGNDGNVLAGAGYYIDGPNIKNNKMQYGLNFFYLAPTRVNGTVLQENLYTNLSYNYKATHYPLYFIAKSMFETKHPKYGVTLDAGIGPNFMSTTNFQENSLGDNSIPDQIFSGASTTTFSVTAGIGLKVNQFFGQRPLECGYRFFYLGQGNFNALTTQTLNTLNTGPGFANALMCSITI